MVNKLDIKELMNSQDVVNAIIKTVVEEVISRLKAKPVVVEEPKKTALVCFSGAAIGFKQAMDSLVKLKNDGWNLKVFMSDSALAVLKEDYVRDTLGVDMIHTAATHTPQRELYADVDQIIIAATTVNTAAKIANGICDNEMLTLINHGLMAGTPFVCAIDGACPDNQTRHQLGMGKSSKGYRAVLVNNLKALLSFGMKLCAAEDLYETCTDQPISSVEEAAPVAEAPKACCVVEEQKKPVVQAPSGIVTFLDKSVITRKDIVLKRGAAVVRVPANAIVTEFAKDAAAEFGITIERN